MCVCDDVCEREREKERASRQQEDIQHNIITLQYTCRPTSTKIPWKSFNNKTIVQISHLQLYPYTPTMTLQHFNLTWMYPSHSNHTRHPACGIHCSSGRILTCRVWVENALRCHLHLLIIIVMVFCLSILPYNLHVQLHNNNALTDR